MGQLDPSADETGAYRALLGSWRTFTPQERMMAKEEHWQLFVAAAKLAHRLVGEPYDKAAWRRGFDRAWAEIQAKGAKA